MSFVFQIDSGFMLVDSKPRQGLYQQYYSKEGFSKPSTLLPLHTTNYTATLDHTQVLHAIAENNKNQIFYITNDNGRISRRVILEDNKQLYHFRDLYLFTSPLGTYIFYTVKHPTGNSRSLMWQSLDSNNPNIQTLISYIPDGCPIKFFTISNSLYIVYTDFDEVYELKLINFSPQGSHTQHLLTSHIPLIDYNLCQTPKGMYLVILKDAYGQQQLSSFNLQTSTEQLLSIIQPVSSPSVFSYCNFLWITYMSNDTLYVLLSDENFGQFSIPVPCSLQGSINLSSYIPKPNSILQATTLSIQINHHLRIPVVSSFDISGIHPDLPLASELDLLFDAIGLSTPIETPLISRDTIEPVISPAIPSPPMPQSSPKATPTAPYATFSPDHLTSPPAPSTLSPSRLPTTESYISATVQNSVVPPISPSASDASLKSVARAFMDSSNTFELTTLTK